MNIKEQPQPPKLADRFLKWYCADRYFEEVQGDLHEWFYQRIEEQGLRKARLYYYLDVLRYFRSFRLKSSDHINRNSSYLHMKNLFRITFRNLRRDLVSAVLRIGNLSMGIVIFLLTLVYARYELNYDRFHKDYQQVYRFGHSLQGEPWAAGPIGLGAMLQTDAPELQSVTRVFPALDTWIKRDDEIFNERRGYFVDSTFFDVFTHQPVDGLLDQSLKRIRSIVITRSMATKYFGQEDPIGQILELGNERGRTRVVSAVIEDVPEQSHLQFDFLLPMMTLGERFTTAWRNWGTYTYGRFYEAADIKAVNARVKEAFLRAYPGNDPEALQPFVTPVADIHLKTNHEKELADNGNTSYVYILLSAGAFVLLISCINFVNLSVIKGLDRGKEVGLRKTIGASRRQITGQFAGESLIVILMASFISVVTLAALSPVFRNFSELSLPLNGFNNPEILWPMLALVLLLQLACGVYPARVLSRLKPAEVLKTGAKGALRLDRLSFLRKGLVVLQFGLSIILVVSSLLIYNQMEYIQNRDMGFEPEQVLLINLDGELREKFPAFRDGLNAIAGVKAVSVSSDVPGYRISMEPVVEIGITKPGEPPNIRTIMADHSFATAYGLELVAGRDFQQESPEGLTEYLLNESAAAFIFEDRNPLQGSVVYRRDTGRVVGVIKDFNFRTIHSTVEPLVISSKPRLRTVSIRFEPQRTDEVMAGIEALSRQFFASLPSIEYEFLSDRFTQLYKAETRLKSLVWFFCIVSVLLTVSGIFGLATYLARQKTREIAIRKVLGSSRGHLFGLMSKNFVALLSVAILMSLPVAYYLSGWWLQNFAYQVPIGALSFVIAIAGVFMLVLLSSGLVTLRAVRANPTEALKSE